jgi:Domain of unknown function (DUF6457)
VNELDEWLAKACAELDIPVIDRGPVLDLARDVAHGVMRPAAPLTAYLVGVAVGRGADPQAAFARVTALAEEWSATHAHSTAGE